jgi:hypothetical protein
LTKDKKRPLALHPLVHDHQIHTNFKIKDSDKLFEQASALDLFNHSQFKGLYEELKTSQKKFNHFIVPESWNAGLAYSSEEYYSFYEEFREIFLDAIILLHKPNTKTSEIRSPLVILGIFAKYLTVEFGSFGSEEIAIIMTKY